MIYLVDWETTAAAVLRVLPTRKNVIKGLPLDPVVVISEVTILYSIHHVPNTIKTPSRACVCVCVRPCVCVLYIIY